MPYHIDPKLIELISNSCLKHENSGETNYDKCAHTIITDLEHNGYEIKKKEEPIIRNRNTLLKQKQGYGCGLYAIANVFNLPDFITPERLEQSKFGNRIGQLTKWLNEHGYDAYIDSLFYDHLGSKLPESALNYVPLGEVSYLPLILVVGYENTEKTHMVGVRIDKSGVAYLYDSLADTVKITSLREINEIYYKVLGMYILIDNNSGNYFFIV